MFELIKSNETKKRMMDLEEGDFAEIEYGRKVMIVYVYRETDTRPLNAISVTSKSDHWSNIKMNTIDVVRVLKEGDILKVVK